MITEAERAFAEEVRDKKRAANGVHSKTGKRGYVGKMYLPFELMTGKEKRAYKKNGKVKVYKMLLTLEEFKALDTEGRRKHLEEILPNYTKQQIKDHWGITDLYYYTRQVGLTPPKKRKGKGEQKEMNIALDLAQDSQQEQSPGQQQELLASISDLQEALLKEQIEKEELTKKVQLLEVQQTAHEEEIRNLKRIYENETSALKVQLDTLNSVVNNLANQMNSLTIPQPQQPSNEILSKLRSHETDLQLLKMLAVR